MVHDIVNLAETLYGDYYQNQSNFDLDTIRQMLEEKILQSAAPTNKSSLKCICCWEWPENMTGDPDSENNIFQYDPECPVHFKH